MTAYAQAVTSPTARAARAVQYFSDHWPIDLLWPLDISPAESGGGQSGDAGAARQFGGPQSGRGSE